MRPTVIYHGDCPDGAGAAIAAWLRFGDAADYRPGFYGEDAAAPDGDVFLLDFSWTRERILAHRAAGHRVVVVDHHQTAQAALAGLDDVTFDMSHSGAVLAWRYFHPEKDVPDLLRYIEDRDLWRFALPQSREVSASLKAQGATVDWRCLLPILEDWKPDDADGIPCGSKRRLIAEGKAILRCEAAMVAAMSRHAHVVVWEGLRCAIVNASVLFSEVAEYVYEDHEADVGIYWFHDHALRRYQVGLRSAPDGPDVSALAKRHGGGGHAHAAGFNPVTLPSSWFP